MTGRRKIKDCICDGTKKVEGLTTIPISMTVFLKTMSVILIMDAKARLSDDYPIVKFNGEVAGGKGVKNPTVNDVISVINLGWGPRSTGQQTQLQGFLDWFMDQYEPEDSEDGPVLMWYMLDFVGPKWNEYAALCKEGKNE